MEFSHIPVLLQETVTGLCIKPDGVYVDGTAGGGNHSFAIGSKLSSSGLLICTDRDGDAIAACEKKLKPLACRKVILRSSFNRIPDILAERNLKADGLLVDLGVSSHQLDESSRGFSYMQDGPLDMRMDASGGLSAADLIRESSQRELERIFFEYGEERYSKRIAAAIVERREVSPISTTLELAEMIKRAMPQSAVRKEKQHPAKRVFQALRIAVNDELFQISDLLEKVVGHMAPGGRIAVITFHSLEDRIVKNAFRRFEHPCTCPPDFPVCVCGKKPLGRAVGKCILPTKREIEQNPRSRSAKLRIFEVADSETVSEPEMNPAK